MVFQKMGWFLIKVGWIFGQNIESGKSSERAKKTTILRYFFGYSLVGDIVAVEDLEPEYIDLKFHCRKTSVFTL